MIRPTIEVVRTWSDELLDDHLRNCGLTHSGYICKGCAEINRKAFETKAVDDGEAVAVLVEGWL